MPETKKNSAAKKPPVKNKVAETNEYEFEAMSSSYICQDIFWGFDVLKSFSPEQLQAIVKDPMGNNKTLRDISNMLYGTNGVYTNTVDYMTSIPSLSHCIVPHGDSARKKKRNTNLMSSVLRKIKHREIVRDALFKGMVDGMCVYYFETTSRPLSTQKFLTDYDVDSIAEINELGLNAAIICLPIDYVKIVGMKNGNYVVAFNLDYFTEVGGEQTASKLRKFPKEIRDAYNKRNKSVTGGNWYVLDENRTIVHKIRSKRDEKYGRPLVLAAINDIIYNDEFIDTKRNVLSDINNRIVYETFPEGQTKGTSGLTKQQQQAQHDAIKGAVTNRGNKKGTNFFSVAAGTKIDSIDPVNADIFDEKYEANLGDKIATDLGIASSLLSGNGSGSYSSQQSNLELVTSQILQWVEQIESELNKVIAANIIKDDKNWVEVRYLPITNVNRSQMISSFKDLYLQGSGSLSMWIAACGIDPDAYFAVLDKEYEDGIYDKYTPHLTSYVMSSKDTGEASAGRPESENPTENTIKNRNSGGNDIPTPSDK